MAELLVKKEVAQELRLYESDYEWLDIGTEDDENRGYSRFIRGYEKVTLPAPPAGFCWVETTAIGTERRLFELAEESK